MRRASVGSAGATNSKGGGGLPRQKLDSVHVPLRSIDNCETRSRQQCVSHPSCIKEAQFSTHLGRLLQIGQQRVHGLVVEHVVTALRRVAGNVTQRPHTLLAYVLIARRLRSVTVRTHNNQMEHNQLTSSCTKMGTAPASMTTRVCSDEPEAMLVRAQAASKIN
jgi:hypothetical protein